MCRALPIESALARMLPVRQICYRFLFVLCAVWLKNNSLYGKTKNVNILDASAIKAEGSGLRDAVSGQKTSFIISTLDAGSGTEFAKVHKLRNALKR